MNSVSNQRARGLAGPVLMMVCLGVMTDTRATAAQEAPPSDSAALRSRIEARYDVVPLSRGIGLRPKDPAARIQMIEITDGTIAIDGIPVSGAELRERIGADADLIRSLSFRDPQELRALFMEPVERTPATEPVEAPRDPPSVAPPPGPAAAAPAEASDVRRRRVGDRVRIFGSVTVPRNESVQGEVVAVLGSVRVDGHVSGEVVAVMGSVDLGPEARVGGDVVAVGGRVRRAEGAQINGNITEVDFRSPDVGGIFIGAPWWIAPGVSYPFTGAARLTSTLFRLFLLGLLASIVVLVVRPHVEQIGQSVRAEPVKMAVIGLLAQLLLFPTLFLVSVVLAITIVGIPLLFILIPVVLVAVLFVLLGGFTGAAYVIGGWARGRASWNTDEPHVRVWLGILLVLTPLLIARLFGLAGGPFQFLALILAFVAVLVEYLVWTTGFGAALAAAFERWRTRRPLPTTAPPAMPPAPE